LKLKFVVLTATLLSGCQRSSKDDALLSALPAKFEIPECSTKVIQEQFHWKAASGWPYPYNDVVKLRVDRKCVERWESSLMSKQHLDCTDHCPIYFERSNEEVIGVFRPGGRDDTIGLAWHHQHPIAGIYYADSGRNNSTSTVSQTK
jgi:hypothetical protein